MAGLDTFALVIIVQPRHVNNCTVVFVRPGGCSQTQNMLVHISRFVLSFCAKAAADVATVGGQTAVASFPLTSSYYHDFTPEKSTLVLFQELVDLTFGVELIAEAEHHWTFSGSKRPVMSPSPFMTCSYPA